MPYSPQAIDSKVLKSVRARQSALTFSAKDFLHLGNSSSIRKALERLTAQGLIRRIRRGFYDRPTPHPLLGKTAPDPMELVKSVMTDAGAQWQVTGAYAANHLNLSEQVPSKIVILTDGTPRKIHLDKLVLDFRRTTPRNLLGAGTTAGMVIQAIRHLRITGVTPNIIMRLRDQLDRATKADLSKFAPKLPLWMQPIIKLLTEI